MIRITYLDFSARLPGPKLLAQFVDTGLGFLARVELCPGVNPSPCNRQFDFKRICFRSRANLDSRALLRVTARERRNTSY